MSSGDQLDGGGSVDDPMIVGDSDEDVSTIDAQDKNNGNTQENQARPDETRGTTMDMQDGFGSNQPVRPMSGIPALASNDQRATCPRRLATPTPSPTVATSSNTPKATIPSNTTITAASNTQTASTPGIFVGGYVAVGIITAPTNTNTATAASTGSQASVPFVAGIPPAGPYPAGPVNRRTRHPGEWFYLHPTDPMKLVAVIKIENPYEPGTYYEQRDEIPILDQTVQSPDKPSFIYLPSLDDAKIPNKHRANKKNKHTPDLWVHHPDGSMNWTRPGHHDVVDRWGPIIVFRRFNYVTKKYEDIHVNLKKLENIDPNDDHNYHHPYNKWLDQIKRRHDRDYVKKTSKNHWSPAERRELYRAVNNFVRQWGLHKFGFKGGAKMTHEQMSVVADAINEVGGMDRQPDAVRSQINNSHAEKNGAIFELMQRADAVRQRLARNEVIPREELHLDQAIPEDEYPVEPNKTANKKVVATDTVAGNKQHKDTSSKPRHKKRTAAVLEEDEDENLSDPPSDLDEPVEPHSSMTTHSPTGTSSNKKASYEDQAGNRLASNGDLAGNDEDSARRPPQDDDEWETTDDELDPKKKARRKAARDMQRAIINSYQRGPATAHTRDGEASVAVVTKRKRKPKGDDEEDESKLPSKKAKKGGRK